MMRPARHFIQLLQNSNLKEKILRWTSEIIQVTEEEQSWFNYRSKHYIIIDRLNEVFTVYILRQIIR